MAHLLIIELPGGNDTDILETASKLGHSFVFLTQDIWTYKKKEHVEKWISKATQVIQSPSFDYSIIESEVLQSHARQAFDAVLCLIDIRLIEASKLANRLNLRYINEGSASLVRDKFKVRQKLALHGIAQAPFELATSNAGVLEAIRKVGLPLLIKPTDGYGSQNILTLQTEEDLEFASEALANLLPLATDYGLGVRSNDRLLIERYMHGSLIGCDTFTLDGKHRLLGVNEKIMFEPPSFAIRGGCFTPNQGQMSELEDYAFSILDAIEFDQGAAHIEIMLTDDGPRLVEVNARLVGAKIPRLLSYALNRSVHEALIHLHLGEKFLEDVLSSEMQFAVTRWFVSSEAGRLKQIELPEWSNKAISCVELLAKPGEQVSFPFENANRLGYVMTLGAQRVDAENLANRFIDESKIFLENV
jgi:biotin carboxylase